ncbi:MAG: hypothetical protein IT440_10820 [Phycisphaeraceae bacterium]|nr:hypothetical protein [Phycisphaeraceae bacterium]
MRDRWVVVAGCVAALTMMSCQSSPKPASPDRNTAEVEREYLEYRASHAGVKLPDRKPEQMASVVPARAAEPAPAPVPVVVAPEPKPATVAAATPAPAPAPAPKPQTKVEPVVTPAPAPVVQPEPDHQPEPKPSPVATPVPPAPKAEPIKVVERPATSVPTPATTAEPAPQTVAAVTPPISSPRSAKLTNISMAASDSYFARSLAASDAERIVKPRHEVMNSAPLPTVNTTISELLHSSKMDDLVDIVTSADQHRLPLVMEAMRQIALMHPLNGRSPLFDLATRHADPVMRRLASDALIRGYPNYAVYSGRRLLAETRRYPDTMAYVADRILQSRLEQLYTAAIGEMGRDVTGQGLFDARNAIVRAGPRVSRALRNFAAVHNGTPSAFVARRLHFWIDNNDLIEDAYVDTFERNPSVAGVVMFRERFGDEAVPLLQKALGNAGGDMKTAIETSLTKLETGAVAAVPPGHVKLQLIQYVDDGQTVTLLTNNALCADMAPGETLSDSGQGGSFRQQVITLLADEYRRLRQQPSETAGTLSTGQAYDVSDLR